MQDQYQKIERFLSVCTKLVDGKFMNADTRVSETLAAIAASRELTQLFSAVTQGFDYPAAKRAYLKPSSEMGGARGQAFMPSDRSEILAFVFCLFVEIDAGTLPFNDFLLRYFYVDGSYTASYTVFAERVVRPFRDIVRDCFPDLERRGGSAGLSGSQDDAIDQIARRIPAEQARIEKYSLHDTEKVSMRVILSAISAALSRHDIADLTALLAGYRYFLRYIGGEDENSAAIFEYAAKL